jgi:hypothetical protein
VTLGVLAIWIFGLQASGIFGAMIAPRLVGADGDATVCGDFGFLGGMFAFACLRLWFGAPRT